MKYILSKMDDSRDSNHLELISCKLQCVTPHLLEYLSPTLVGLALTLTRSRTSPPWKIS
jgi:hypothetical protein